MGLFRQHSFRVLTAVFCSIGVFGVVDPMPPTWTLWVAAGLSSAVFLPLIFHRESLAQPNVRVSR